MKLNNEGVKMPDIILALDLIEKSNLTSQEKSILITKCNLDGADDNLEDVKMNLRKMKSILTTKENVIEDQTSKTNFYGESDDRSSRGKFMNQRPWSNNRKPNRGSS